MLKWVFESPGWSAHTSRHTTGSCENTCFVKPQMQARTHAVAKRDAPVITDTRGAMSHASSRTCFCISRLKDKKEKRL